MNRKKKFLSLILSMILLFTLSMPVMAAGDEGETSTNSTYTITIKDIFSGHTYEAYQIFDGTFDASTGVLSNITWGEGFKLENTGSFLGALKEADAQKVFKGAFDSITYTNNAESNDDEHEVAKKIAKAIEDAKVDLRESEFMKEFARILHRKDVNNQNYLYLTGVCETSACVDTDGEKVNGVVQYTYTISGLDDGYYLIKDSDGSISSDKYDYYTRLMLYVVKNIDITPKGNVPKVSKSVNTTVNGNFN